MKERQIDVNVDAGESFGRWVLGDDARLFPHVSSANIACGFHAGDPTVIHKTIKLAMQSGVSIGAHPGLPDLQGFGRRRMEATRQQIIDGCVYQVAALIGFVRVEGAVLTHVKPHGALYGMLAAEPNLAIEVAEAMLALEPDATFVTLAGPTAEAVSAAGIPVLTEAFPDLDYDDEGSVIIEPIPEARPPEQVADRALNMVQGRITTVGGKTLPVEAQTLCIHGDRPNAAEIAIAVREKFLQEGIKIASPFSSNKEREGD